MTRRTEFLVILGYFLPFDPPNNLKIKVFKKWKKSRRYYHFTLVYHKWQSYDVWFLRYGAWQTEFFVSLDHYFLYPTVNPKNQNFKKMKKKKQNKTITKTPGDIIILHKCTRNHDHLLYCSWEKASDGCNCYFSVWAIFCNFTPPPAQKVKILKKEKTPGDAIILHMCTKNYDQMYYSWDMVGDGATDVRTEKVTYRGGYPN